MKIAEILLEDTVAKKPHLYLDMDGVQADFFDAWAKFEKVRSYKDIQNPEEAISKLASMGPEYVHKFFRDLKPLQGGMKILKWLHQHKIPFTVLSAPLRTEGPASIEGKKEWLDKYNPGTSNNAIFTSKKYEYATNKDGSPNVLVDDYSKYLDAWDDHNGIAIKHSDDSADHTIQQLEKIYLNK